MSGLAVAYRVRVAKGDPVAASGTDRERRTRSRRLLAAFFIGSGVNHFVMPRPYRAIVPPGFGDPAMAVTASGVAEIVGGAGALLPPPARRLAGWWLIGVLLAVY